REPCPIRGHRVVARHRADDDRIAVRALVALHSDRADRRQHGERLPEIAVETGTTYLLLQHRIGVAQDLEPLARDVADDANRETGPWKRLPPHHALRHAELLADTPHLVLEQEAQRLDELHL